MLSELCPLKVVAPIPWFPFKSVFERNSAGPQIPKKEVIAGIETFHPRYFTIPKIGRSLYGLLFFLSILVPIVRMHSTFRFDVIFATWAYPDSFAAVLISKLLNKPILTKIHGTDINEYTRYWLRRKMISFALNNSEGVISVSKALRDSIIEIGVKPEKIKVIYNGVDGEIFRPLGKIHARKALGIDIDKKVVLFVGNLEFVKGLTYLIRAFASIATGPSRNVILIIIGQGRLRRELENEVRKYGIQNCVYMPGSKTHHEISKWMNACDLLCLPSLNEGVPNVILEALACGKPVVATNVGGIPEIVCDGKNGILVESRNSQQIADAILKALTFRWDTGNITRSIGGLSWGFNAKCVYELLLQMKKTFYNLD